MDMFAGLRLLLQRGTTNNEARSDPDSARACIVFTSVMLSLMSALRSEKFRRSNTCGCGLRPCPSQKRRSGKQKKR